jgi:hypothetical protein
MFFTPCLCSCSVAVHRRWALTFCETLCVSSGEDAVLAEGAFPSQEVTERLGKLSWKLEVDATLLVLLVSLACIFGPRSC